MLGRRKDACMKLYSHADGRGGYAKVGFIWGDMTTPVFMYFPTTTCIYDTPRLSIDVSFSKGIMNFPDTIQLLENGNIKYTLKVDDDSNGTIYTFTNETTRETTKHKLKDLLIYH